MQHAFLYTVNGDLCTTHTHIHGHGHGHGHWYVMCWMGWMKGGRAVDNNDDDADDMSCCAHSYHIFNSLMNASLFLAIHASCCSSRFYFLASTFLVFLGHVRAHAVRSVCVQCAYSSENFVRYQCEWGHTIFAWIEHNDNEQQQQMSVNANGCSQHSTAGDAIKFIMKAFSDWRQRVAMQARTKNAFDNIKRLGN